jgi:tRNA A-37 threonylcarbamoyl transferase component Bud32
MIDEATIEKLIKRTDPSANISGITVKKFGSIFNTLFEIRFRKNDRECKLMMKNYDDWAGLKWLPAAIYAMGTKSFSISSRSRLAREYAANKILKKKGFKVPEILFINRARHLLIEEFIEGEVLADIIRKIISNGRATENEKNIIRKVGETFARIHKSQITLGDTKPDNIIITKDGKVCIVDLEQARKGGDPAWDISEFLYFSCHFVSLTDSRQGISIITKSFIDGYLSAGGSRNAVVEAGRMKYMRLYTIISLPPVLGRVSGILRDCA